MKLLPSDKLVTKSSHHLTYCILHNVFFPTVPGGAPTGILVTNVSSHALLIMWSPPSVPNGIITAYTVYIDYNNGTSEAERVTAGSASSYLLEGLSPFQLVGVQMAANTSVGEGPRSNTTDGRTNPTGIARIFELATAHCKNILVKMTTSACTLRRDYVVVTKNLLFWLHE